MEYIWRFHYFFISNVMALLLLIWRYHYLLIGGISALLLLILGVLAYFLFRRVVGPRALKVSLSIGVVMLAALPILDLVGDALWSVEVRLAKRYIPDAVMDNCGIQVERVSDDQFWIEDTAIMLSWRSDNATIICYPPTELKARWYCQCPGIQ